MKTRKAKDKPSAGKTNTKNPGDYHHGNLRQALIATGLDMIREQGLPSLSLREVARKIGVSEAAPYRHFPNKESLLAAIATEGFQKLTGHLEASASPGLSPTAQLHDRSWAYVEFALEETDQFLTMFTGELLPPHAENHPELIQAGMRAFESPIEIFNELKKEGSIHPETDVHSAAVMCFSAVHGLTMLLIGHQLESLGVTQPKARATLKTIIDTFIAGLRLPPSGRIVK
jgi:AcrR family transcriptional regulator